VVEVLHESRRDLGEDVFDRALAAFLAEELEAWGWEGEWEGGRMSIKGESGMNRITHTHTPSPPPSLLHLPSNGEATRKQYRNKHASTIPVRVLPLLQNTKATCSVFKFNQA